MEYTFLGLLLVIVFVLITTVFGKLSKLENRMKEQIAKVVDVPEHLINDELRKLFKEGKEI